MVPLHCEDLVGVVVLGHARHRDRADHPAERPHAVADAHLLREKSYYVTIPHSVAFLYSTGTHVKMTSCISQFKETNRIIIVAPMHFV